MSPKNSGMGYVLGSVSSSPPFRLSRYSCIFSSTSFLGTAMRRRSKSLNRRMETKRSGAVRYYSNPDRSLAEMIEVRWPDGVVRCPTCGRDDVRFIATRRLWECKGAHERRQFSVKVGTIFEDSPLGLDKWLTAVWKIANCKNGVSSYEIGRALGITQKSAWFLLHRIRAAMHTGTFNELSGDVEVDETFIGGRAQFMHLWKRAAKITTIR